MRRRLRTLTLAVFSIWASNAPGADEPRIVSVTSARAVVAKDKMQGQLVAGEESLIKFDPVPAKLSAIRIGLVDPTATPAPSPSPSVPPVTELPSVVGTGDLIRVTLPKGQPAGLYKLVYSEAPASSADPNWKPGSVVTVWRLPNATITDISPKVLRPDSAVKVTGTGLTAPASEINLTVGGLRAQVTRVDPDGRWFAAMVPKETGTLWPTAIRPVKGTQISLWEVPATWPDDLDPRIERSVNWLWTLVLFLFGGVGVALVYYLIARIYRTYPKARSWISAALIEAKNNTYSLARAQFIWWLTIITWGYMFLFLGRGWIEGIWAFPPLSGFAYTFLISLGTLVAAEVTSAVRGVKGAGVTSPSPSDLVMHGGVLALERVQQVMWTVVVGLMFLFITVKSYSTSTSLPTIPTELLTLMGFSSLGYVVGKTARKPGPVISSITPVNSSLQIVGENFSATGARIQIDGVTIESAEITAKPPVTTGDFVRAMEVRLTEVQAADWAGKSHIVLVTNADEQFAEWKSPPRLAKVHSISAPGADGTVQLVIQGENIQLGAVLSTDDDPKIMGVQHPSDPSLWTLTVNQNWLTQPHLLHLENPDGTSSKATWKEGSAVGASL